MQNVISEVVVAVPEFSLSPAQVETVSAAAEMLVDSKHDYRKSCDAVAGLFGDLKAAGLLSFASWEVVRKRFEAAAAVRSRDNGAIDPEGASRDAWHDVACFLREYHGLTKPKSENPEAAAKQAKREAEKAKALEAAKDKPLADLEAEKRALYAQASDESIAKAKALEKVIKVVATAEREAVSAQMKPLIDAAAAGHKAIMEFMKTQNDPVLLGDYVVLLKRTLDIWKEAK